MIIKLDRTNTIKKVSRNEYLDGHRKTGTQVIRSKKTYTRKTKHKGL